MKINTNPMTGLDALQLMFIYLKLSNQINWSWWMVLSPLWLLLLLALFVIFWNWK